MSVINFEKMKQEIDNVNNYLNFKGNIVPVKYKKILPDIHKLKLKKNSSSLEVSSITDRSVKLLKRKSTPIPVFENKKINSDVQRDKTPNSKLFRLLSSRTKIRESINKSPIFVSQAKVPDIFQFHTKLLRDSRQKYLSKGHSSIEISISDFDDKLKQENKKDNKEIANIREMFLNQFHSQKSIFNICKDVCDNKRLELRFIKKKADSELKDMILEEIKKAKKKLNLNLSFSYSNTSQALSLCLKKLKHYFYLSKENPVLEFNKEGKLPNMFKDGALMNKLLNDGFSQINTRKKYFV